MKHEASTSTSVKWLLKINCSENISKQQKIERMFAMREEEVGRPIPYTGTWPGRRGSR